jgi:hypothetical protein
MQKGQIGLVNIDAGESERRTERQKRNDATDFYHLKGPSFVRGFTHHRPYQSCLPDASPSGHLRNICAKLPIFLQIHHSDCTFIRPAAHQHAVVLDGCIRK